MAQQPTQRRGRPSRASIHGRLEFEVGELRARLGGLPLPAEAEDIWTAIWYEEAGPEALISARTMEEGFRGTGVSLNTRTSVFLPPHLINLLPRGLGLQLLRFTDRACGAIPGLSRNGGLILIEGLKGS